MQFWATLRGETVEGLKTAKVPLQHVNRILPQEGICQACCGRLEAARNLWQHRIALYRGESWSAGSEPSTGERTGFASAERPVVSVRIAII